MSVRALLGGTWSLLLAAGLNAEPAKTAENYTPAKVNGAVYKPLLSKFADAGIAEVKPAAEVDAVGEAKSSDLPPTVSPPLSVYSPLTATDFRNGPRMWANAEIVLWWMKPGPAPALATRGNPADALPGALGQPGTRVIYGGGDDVSYGSQGGFRFNIGGWIDETHDLGLELGGIFFGAKNGTAFFAGGDNLYLPITPVTDGAPTRFIISDSAVGYSGRVNFTNEMRFWGLEANALSALVDEGNYSINAIAGFRYLDLSERLSMNLVSADTLFGGTLTATDSFRTRNQFYGGQLGLQADIAQGRVFASLRTTVALGGTHQTRDSRGLSSGDAPPAGTFPNGVYVQSTNSGHFTDNQFSVVPQVGLKLGMDVLPFLRIFAGYDFLYWTNVVRPGDQIDTRVNFSQSFGGTLAGPARPVPFLNSSDFWAHGVTLGLQLRY